MRLAELVETSGRVAATSSRLEKTALLADLLRRSSPEHLAIAVSYLTGSLLQNRLGVGPATVYGAMPEQAVDTPTLTLEEVNAAFADLSGISGKGSAGERSRKLAALFARATREEQTFLAGLI